MLTLSPAAAEAVRKITDDDRLPDSAGLRVSSGAGPDGAPALQLTVVEQPAASDAVVDHDDAVVFVEAELTAALDDKLLDAEIGEEHVNFSLRPAQPS